MLEELKYECTLFYELTAVVYPQSAVTVVDGRGGD